MRSILHLGGAEAAALAEEEGVRKSSHAGGDMDGRATGKIETAELVDPPARVPGPAGDGVVDEGCPYEHEDEAGGDAAAIRDGADCKGDTVEI